MEDPFERNREFRKNTVTYVYWYDIMMMNRNRLGNPQTTHFLVISAGVIEICVSHSGLKRGAHTIPVIRYYVSQGYRVS